MQRNLVNSPDFKSAGYDPSTHVLEIEFHSGHTYQYFNVPNTVYSDLLNSGSPGRYFHSHIRDVYQAQKV